MSDAPDITTKNYCIYRITCFRTGKVYVGQTMSLHIRQNQHWWHLKRGVHPNLHLQSAYKQYGRSAFYFEVLENDIPESKINDYPTLVAAAKAYGITVTGLKNRMAKEYTDNDTRRRK
ncbi:MAG: GIY-YIG nuclease family protein [Anaerolineae bacterium]|nr:GIY-YIG nuclease family protein [Anaerolineae bacterium]